MAIGAFLGFNLASNKNWIKHLYSNTITSIALFVSPFLIWFCGASFGFFTEEIYAVLFGFMILVVVNSKKINIDNKVTVFLGKISYGIYMYHWIIITALIELLSPFKKEIYFDLSLYMGTFIITILVSWISFMTFEKFFLNLKKKFEIKL